jgi:hypothetical protein
MIVVNILDKYKYSEQQFITKVAIMETTYHINLVLLLGYFSWESKRDLVYEYMVNISLDKYIHEIHQDEFYWKKLHSITIGTNYSINPTQILYKVESYIMI